MKTYDVMLYASGTYLSGAFYDTYEYFRMFKKLGYNVCFVSLHDVPKEDIRFALRDRYKDALTLEETKDIYLLPFKDSFKKLIHISAAVIFTTSIYAAANIINRPILIPHNKMILIHETVYDDPDIVKAFVNPSGIHLKRILMLGDRRTFGVLGDFEHRDYRRKLNFDIWKQIYGPVDENIMLNMSTEQKCYDVGYLNDLMMFYGGNYLIYTRREFYDKYKVLARKNRVFVEVAPIINFMNRWTKAMYLNSKRGQDPSPRVIAECKYYEKELIWHRQGEFKDGAYYRNIDVLNGLDRITLTPEDEIFEIVDGYL